MSDVRTVDRKRMVSITEADIDTLARKDVNYKGSWKRRGGRGAYFTFVRCWDRLEACVDSGAKDLFELLQKEKDDGIWQHDGTLSAAIADLRRYMLLVEEEMLARFGWQGYAFTPEKPTPSEE